MRETWVVVADSGRARVFAVDTPHGPLTDVACLVNTEAREHERALASDKAGRMAGGHGEGAHGVGDERHFKDIEAKRFAERIARFLGEAHGRRAYERLVICAGPRFLGHIRDAVPRDVAGCVTAELDKDLAHIVDNADLRKHLPERLY